jgi:2-polyprenyl-3-methyl-5-hydroxy-6-metoxy-1,4-benzoquinol methylase
MESDGPSSQSIPCPICGSSDRRTVWDQQVFCMSQCRECDLYYQSPRLSEAGLLAWRRERSKANAAATKAPTGQQGQPRTASKRTIEGDRADCLEALAKIETFKKSGDMFEVGFGRGLLLALARDNGWNVRGLDNHERTVVKAKEQYALDVWCGTLEKSSLPERSFDVLVVRQVLEHVHDLNVFMEKANHILKDDGLLFIEMPNIAGLEYRVKDFLGTLHLRRPVWSSMHLPGHLYYFSPVTLSRFMDKHGFDVLTWETFSHFRRRGRWRYRLTSLRHVLRVGNKMRFFLKKRTSS